MKKFDYKLQLAVIVFTSLLLRFWIFNLIDSGNTLISALAILISLGLGTFVIFLIAKIIEEATGILRARTGLAGGLLQAVGTALPDMIVGITAALMSISVIGTNYGLAVNYAIIAASSTFGSNIYNMGFAAWCISRQNIANRSHKNTKLFPIFNLKVKPMDYHISRPNLMEINTSIRVIGSLSILTALVVLLMVFFGRVNPPAGFSGELYSLKPIIGVIVLALALIILYRFRKNYGDDATHEKNFFQNVRTVFIWLILGLCAAMIFLTAETMVESVNQASALLGLPVVIGGTLAGIIGCLAEMIVVYRFTINPKGRIGDAVVGVAMDNIITLIGAAIVATLGGIFLGGSSLIVIFILILTVNNLLSWQVSELKDFFTDFSHFKDKKLETAKK